MWTKEERLKRMTKGLSPEGLPPKRVPEHCKLACSILDKLGKELIKREIGYLEDYSHPYHIIVYKDGKDYSLWCGGFTKRIDIARLTKSGSPDKRFKERAYMTVTGAVNCLVKLLG